MSAAPRTEKAGAGLTHLLGYRHEGVVQRFACLHGASRERAEALRHQSLQSHAAGGAKQVRPDLALLERRDKDAVWPPRQ